MYGADDPDTTQAALSAWPAFVDLLAATTLLLLALLAVILVWAGAGKADEEGRILLQRQMLAAALESKNFDSRGEQLFTIDTTSDLLFVRVTLSGDASFPTNQFQWDSLKVEARTALEQIGEVLGEPEFDSIYRELRVVGHTDQAAFSEAFSNWELSAARAAVVARYLVSTVGVDPCKVSAVGYGPYRPVVPPPPSNQASNRRIELELLPTARQGSLPATDRESSCYTPGDGTAGGASGPEG